MTSVWDTRAKGLYVEDKDGIVAPLELTGMDFLIAKTGALFTEQIQSAYECTPKIPLIAFYENNPEPYLEMGFSEASWPSADNDPQIAYLDRMLGYSRATGKISRVVNGFMLSCAKVWYQQGTKKFTPNWIVEHGRHMHNLIWNRYHLIMYLYIDSNPWLAWKNEDPEGIQKLNGFVKDEISTVSIAKEFSGIVPATGQMIQLPADSLHWYFWLYGSAPRGARFIYNGNKSMLYSELGYTAPSTTNPEEPPEEEIYGVDLIEMYEKLDGLDIKLEEIKGYLTKLDNNIIDIKKHFVSLE